MIHLIEGRSGSGKTRFLFDKLSKLADSGGEKLLYLIPEQSSFECERAFLRLLGPRKARNVSVMSFTRLYDMVMSETGGVAGTPIDDGARKLLMSVTLEDCADALRLYEKQASKPWFVQTALDAVKELKQCGIAPDGLREKARMAGESELEMKLGELALIYELYNANVEKSGVDPLDNDTRLRERIAKTRFFDGYTVAADDFSGFTASQQRIIDLMMEQSKDFYITLCRDPDSDEELFFTVNRTRKRLTDSARRMGLKIAPPVRLGENKRSESEALSVVEELVYRRRDEGDIPDLSAATAGESVRVTEAKDFFDECEYAAREIRRLACSGVCRYRDIAVVFRNSENYDGVIDKSFEKYGVPYFMSKPQPIDDKPLMRFLLSSLEYALAPSDETKLFAAVKSGLLGVSYFRIAQLENYAFVWGLKGRSFLEPFTLNPRGFSEEFKEGDKELLDRLNGVREKITAPLSELISKLKSDDGKLTAKEISTALYELLVSCKIPELFRRRASEGREFSSEELRLWDMLMDILHKMHASLGERRITPARYCELLKLVIRGEDISDIPQTLDQVIIGKADRVRLDDPYAVFVIGASAGEFPHIPVSDGVFSDSERKRLISLGLPLYDPVEELFLQEKYFAYCALSAPRRRLYVSYPKSSLTGERSEPSSIVSEICQVLPALAVASASSEPDKERLFTDRNAFEIYARRFGRSDPFTCALGEYLKDDTDFSDAADALGASIKNINASVGNREVTKAMYGSDKHLSASQVEKFYKCRFGYFCSYGANLTDRKRAELDSSVYGTLLHYILEHVIERYKEKDYAPFDDGELDELISALLDSFIKTELGGEGSMTKRVREFCLRSKKRAAKTISHMMAELSATDFRPVDTELEIGMSGSGIREYELETPSGGKVSVRGKIDRVDLLEEDGKAYVRIVDYKTNGKTLNLDEAIRGINLQMLIYLAAVSKNGAERYGVELDPAAVLYMKADSSAVKLDVTPDSDEAAIEKAAEKEFNADLRMKGLYVSGDALGDKDYRKKYFSGTAVNERQLKMIFDRVERRIIEMSEELDAGSVYARPAAKRRDDDGMSCKYCEFKVICRREFGDPFTVIPAMKNDDVLRELEEGEEESENG